MELWARKRPIEGKGQPYEFIFSFEDGGYCHTAIGTLDKDIYQECMIVNNNECIMYVEFEKPFVKKRGIRK